MWKISYKIFLHCIDIAIFALGYFILPHPVYRSIIGIDIDIDKTSADDVIDAIRKLPAKQCADSGPPFRRFTIHRCEQWVTLSFAKT